MVNKFTWYQPIFDRLKIRAIRCSVHKEPRFPYENLDAWRFKKLTLKFEDDLWPLTGAVWTPWLLIFFYGKEMIAWMRAW